MFSFDLLGVLFPYDMSLWCEVSLVGTPVIRIKTGYWPAFSRLDDAGQQAFWNVLGAREVDKTPRIAIFVRGGVVQEVASDTPDILIKLLDMDSIEEGDAPDHWRVPDVVIADRERFEAYTSGGQTL
jgi:hypothetical protein